VTQRLSLVLVSNGGRKEISVSKGEEFSSLLIGRAAEADLFLNDTGVSRRHCRIFRRVDLIMIEDLESRAGTFLNGKRVSKPVGLRDCDEIGIGGVVLRVHIEGKNTEDRAAPTPALDKKVIPIEPSIEASKAVTNLVIPLGREPLILGRAPFCSMRLDHPAVSRRHVKIQLMDGAFVVCDLSSMNGTFLNGKLLREPRPLARGDSLKVGPYNLIFDGTQLVSNRPEAGTRIDVRGLGKKIKDHKTGQPLWLLRDISLTILPKEFVGLLGSSGCGKSTFMDAVNGRRPATEGAVLYNSENLYNQFDTFKTGIGCIPQELIFHQQLPLADALRYASRLRLPDDVTDDEIETNIDRVLDIVGLSQQRRTVITNLSGGQKKRVSISMELLSRPTLLFLDEVTSGLDLGIEAQMMNLFRSLADGGVTTMCVTHYVDSLEMCDMVAYFVKGRLAYYGPPTEMKAYFGINAMREVYLKEAEKTAEEWEATFRASSAHAHYITGRTGSAENIEVTAIQPGQPLEVFRQSNPKRQFWVLTSRYMQVMLADWRQMLLTLGLAPIIGLLVIIVLSKSENESNLALAGRQGQLCFILTLIVFFLGIFGAIREIVKELAIYRHERFINLEILPYLGSKVLPLAAISAVQIIELLVVIHLGTDLRVDEPAHIVRQFILLFCTAAAATFLGLAISAAADSSDKAVMLMILVLIPQLLLSNAWIELKGLGKLLGQLFILTYWCYDGLKSLLPDELLQERYPATGGHVLFGHHGWAVDLATILVFATLYTALAVLFLRKKDGLRGKRYYIPWIS
jgi:ABC-type multidrug transport system ATPase subunit/pSer/pThr/pTyr-binding forkhead associated (FHA) protein/ABC-type multidrug transport system permease subunit